MSGQSSQLQARSTLSAYSNVPNVSAALLERLETPNIVSHFALFIP
jgi:hypothetical protein